jgi:hypothetical protein
MNSLAIPQIALVTPRAINNHTNSVPKLHHKSKQQTRTSGTHTIPKLDMVMDLEENNKEHKGKNSKGKKTWIPYDPALENDDVIINKRGILAMPGVITPDMDNETKKKTKALASLIKQHVSRETIPVDDSESLDEPEKEQTASDVEKVCRSFIFFFLALVPQFRLSKVN